MLPGAVFCILSFTSVVATAETPEELNREDSLYSDVKARKIGDVLQVIVSESNSARNSAGTSTKKEDRASTGGESTTGALRGLFPGVSGSLDMSNEFKGTGGTNRAGTFTSRMSVRVVDVLPGGNLVIEGTKSIEVNQELEVITISGLVKPHDVTASNTIYSYQIANAKITYKGKGVTEQGHRPGIFARLFNWLM